MALRLSSPKNAPAPVAPRAGDVAARAQALLLARDYKGYRSLFDQASAVEDVHARYRTRVMLIEQGLGAAGAVPQADVPQLFLTVAKAAVELLEEEPREPFILNYLGVALYELGALDQAEALFRATRRLDPNVPHVEDNLGHVARRRKRGKLALPKAVSAALVPVAARGKACADRARPAEGLSLSLCMIVKDEEEMLPRCLEAAAPAVDEIIVVDTGSSDRTIEIAKSFGAKVIEFEWTGSFADARNVSIDAATGDWLMYLDADEVLVAEDAPRLRELTGHTWREAFYLVETNFTGDLEDGMAVTHNAMRVFRNRPGYRFKGRVHEQVAHALPGFLPERFESTTVRVEHYGYLGAVRDAKEKSRRNLELLEKQAADGIDTPFHAFNMGSEYAAAGDEKKALASFQKAWDMLVDDQQRTSYGYVPSLTNRLVKALRICGDLEGAESRADDGLELFPGFTDLVLEQAKCARARGDLDSAVALTERCLEMGDAPAKYSSTVGSGTYLAMLALAELHTLRGGRAEAEQVLLTCLEQHPAFLGAVLPLATAMLASGKDAADVVEAIESRVTNITPSVNFMLGAALYESGAAAEAEQRFAAVLERQPASGPARVALAESLLSQARYDEAATVAAAIGAGEPLAGAARRAELFALLVSGESDAAAGALANGRSDLAEGDLALFDAWLSAARGGALPPRLPASSASLLVVTLEALLRVREVDAFGMLVPLLDVTGLPWRDRRELLASMYLRRGFLDSAAEEWIGVVEDTGPDAGAMLGLAQVAAARDLHEDALVFATEARELDPSNAGAVRLIESLAGAAA